ncbi:MAG: hypothetical protein IJZ80_07305 [Clostridia bacterium]|nr:hypothetical protein [Clostridia bacterium]
MKKVISMVVLVVMLFSCLTVNSFAAAPETVMPLWDNTSLTSINMVFGETTGAALMRVTGKSGVNQIDGYCIVYVRDGNDWVYVTELSKTVYRFTCYLEVPFYCEVGCEYKADFTFQVHKNGVIETIEQSVTKICT